MKGARVLSNRLYYLATRRTGSMKGARVLSGPLYRLGDEPRGFDEGGRLSSGHIGSLEMMPNLIQAPSQGPSACACSAAGSPDGRPCRTHRPLAPRPRARG